VKALPIWGWVVLALFVACFGWFVVAISWPEVAGRSASFQPGTEKVLVRAVNAVALLAIPFLVAFFPLYAALRRIPVYEEFVEGAKEGFHVGVRLIPFLVAMLLAIGMFRGAGGVDLLTGALRPVLNFVGFPPELLPMGLMRPLSGSATLAIFSDLVKAHGADSLLARMGGTLFGSTETTFYVIVIYFGAVTVKRTRHAVPAGLIADAVGIVASVLICRWVFA
jgi:spore maturation protein B